MIGRAWLWSIQCGAGSAIARSCDVCRSAAGGDGSRLAFELAVEILYGEVERGAAAGRGAAIGLVAAARCGGMAVGRVAAVRCGGAVLGRVAAVRCGGIITDRVGEGARRTSCAGCAVGFGGSGSSMKGSLKVGTLDVQLSQPQLGRAEQ